MKHHPVSAILGIRHPMLRLKIADEYLNLTGHQVSKPETSEQVDETSRVAKSIAAYLVEKYPSRQRVPRDAKCIKVGHRYHDLVTRSVEAASAPLQRPRG